jgi:hypothetical protein
MLRQVCDEAQTGVRSDRASRHPRPSVALAPFLRWLRSRIEGRDGVFHRRGYPRKCPPLGSGAATCWHRTFNASALGGFMMQNDFTNDKGKKLFRKLWIEFSSRRKLA